MLYIVLAPIKPVEFGAVMPNVERQWHSSEPMPVKDAEVLRVVEVQADGDELERIANVFANIPRRIDGSRVMRWFGDTAKFIVANLLET